MTGPRYEAPRDVAESAFTPILRRLWDQLPTLLAAAFVDLEGECIDYISRVDPFEAKLHAAHLHVLLDRAATASSRLGAGRAFGLEIGSAECVACVRKVSEEYLLVVVLEAAGGRPEFEDALGLASAEFRLEVGLEAPAWEASQRRLSVRVRPATGWHYAPQGYSEGGVRVTITDVLGRWTESGGVLGEQLVCFRVRTEEGRELTLVHDPDGFGWIARE